MSADEAFVTLATTDEYCLGAEVVARGLRRHGTSRSAVVLVTAGVSAASRRALEQVFDRVVQVEVLDSGDQAGLFSLGRPELGVTFTKIQAWRLTRYRKCVFLDADTLVLQNVDELFQREELSAAPDPGWPDCFNTGVFVFRPSLETYDRLLDHARQHGSFDGGDQGLLNAVFSDWAVRDLSRRLPFLYNLSISSVYTYLPAFQRFGHNARIIHFLGPTKPWHSGQAGGEGTADGGRRAFVALWWREYLQQAAPVQHRSTQQVTSSSAPQSPGAAESVPSSSAAVHPPSPPEKETEEEEVMEEVSDPVMEEEEEEEEVTEKVKPPPTTTLQNAIHPHKTLTHATRKSNTDQLTTP